MGEELLVRPERRARSWRMHRQYRAVKASRKDRGR